jgi:hypothetical protein
VMTDFYSNISALKGPPMAGGLHHGKLIRNEPYPSL